MTARARYLFEQAGADRAAPALQILARNGRALRELVRQWWIALEPEATAGVVVPRMEEALAAFASEALKKKDRSFSRKWAWSWFDWKPGPMQSKAEQAIGERFLVAMERLGVLQTLPGSRIEFTHEVLLELWHAVGFLLAGKPVAIPAGARSSTAPLGMLQGRVAVARLAVTPPEDRREALRAVAKKNVHVAVWFLWGDENARAAEGQWLASEILGELQWGQADVDREQLEAALTSLGDCAIAACRTLLDERKANLPAHLVAIRFLERFGNGDDLPRLRRFLDEPAAGWWEIEQLRKTLRDAEAKIVDPATRSRYTKHEIAEMAKDTAALIIQIAGAFASHVEPLPWGSNTAIAFGGGLAGGAGETLIDVNVSDFYRAQQVLRDMVGSLPPLIERRKVEIHSTAPLVRAAAQAAIGTLTRSA